MRSLNISYAVWFNRKILAWLPARTLLAKRSEYCERFREQIAAGDLGIAWKERLAGNSVLGEEYFVGGMSLREIGDAGGGLQ